LIAWSRPFLSIVVPELVIGAVLGAVAMLGGFVALLGAVFGAAVCAIVPPAKASPAAANSANIVLDMFMVASK